MVAEKPSERNGTVTVVVPAYNEAVSLPALMPSLVAFVRARGWKLIVVDDCSVDGTSAALQPYDAEVGVTILRHKVNRGYGGALKTAVREATTDLVVTFDAEGSIASRTSTRCTRSCSGPGPIWWSAIVAVIGRACFVKSARA